MRTMTMRAIVVAILCAVLAACTTPGIERLKSNLKAYLGRPEADVLRDFGPPEIQFQQSGMKFIGYSNRRIGGRNMLGKFEISEGWGGGTPNDNCLVNFTVMNGIVTGLSASGLDCRM